MIVGCHDCNKNVNLARFCAVNGRFPKERKRLQQNIKMCMGEQKRSQGSRESSKHQMVRREQKHQMVRGGAAKY